LNRSPNASAPQGKDHHHLGRPRTDAFYIDESRVHLVVGKVRQSVQLATHHLLGNRTEAVGFRLGKSQVPQGAASHAGQPVRVQADAFLDPPEDRPCGMHGDHLRDHGSGERLEQGPLADGGRCDAPHEASHMLVPSEDSFHSRIHGRQF
jgi:hypothetical protein